MFSNNLVDLQPPQTLFPIHLHDCVVQHFLCLRHCNDIQIFEYRFWNVFDIRLFSSGIRTRLTPARWAAIIFFDASNRQYSTSDCQFTRHR